MNHTKEPWFTTQNKKWGNADYRISNKENDEWANFNQIAYASEFNAKRIVACVNACAGITNEALEAGIVKGCIEIIQNQTPRPDDGIWRWMSIPVFDKEDV